MLLEDAESPAVSFCSQSCPVKLLSYSFPGHGAWSQNWAAKYILLDNYDLPISQSRNFTKF